MNAPKYKFRISALSFVLLLMLSGCSSAPVSPAESLESTQPGQIEDMKAIIPTTPPAAAGNRPLRPVTTTVTLSDTGIYIDGIGAQAEGSILTITADGVYEIKGSLSDGQIIINAPDAAEVELLLAGAEITSSENAAIYCMNADNLIISLADGTENTLTDAANYTYADAVNEEPDAVLFSKVDMNIGGSGSLTVNAYFMHGISSKDDLIIEDGNFTIYAASHGIRGRDSLTVLDGIFDIEAGGDGIQSSNIERADYGWVLLTGGQYSMRVNGDGIQAETALTVQGGTYDITTSGNPANDSTSQKGLKAGTILTVSDGDFKINSIDDGVHSNVDATIEGGTFLIETGDDGIHADRNLAVKGGTIDVMTCYEGFEGTTVVISGGKSFISSSDDAISAAGGTDGTAVRPRADPDVYVRITGGELEAVSGGDTVDANGYIFIDGGTIRLSSPPRPSR